MRRHAVRFLLVVSMLATMMIAAAAPAAAYPVVTFADLDNEIAATSASPANQAELYAIADVAESAANSSPSQGCFWLDVFDLKVRSLDAKRRLGHRDAENLYETTYWLRVNLGCIPPPV